MSQGPPLASRTRALSGSVYSSLAARLASFEGETFPFHVGDTWLEPPEGCGTEDVHAAEHPGLNRYTPVSGWPPLVAALREEVGRRTGVAVEEGGVLVSAGATAALGALLGALVEPGSEVMILAPAWPLVAGMTTAFGGRPVHVPFLGEVDQPEAVAEVLDPHRTERSVAVYLNTPNNPSGRVMSPAVVEAVVRWAVDRGLRVISDEVYDELGFTGEHAYARSFAPAHVVSAWSFSKAYGMAGNRCGWIAGPADVVGAAAKIGTYTYYCAPRVAQAAGLRALSDAGRRWVADARRTYEALGREAAEVLGEEAPQGGTFLFVDLARHLGEDVDLSAFLSSCVDRGLLVAPGPAFGPYPSHVRVCFTAAPPDVTRRGLAVLAELLGR